MFFTGDDVLNRSITHPDVSDRIKAFNDLDAQLPESLRNNSRHLREKSAELMDLD